MWMCYLVVIGAYLSWVHMRCVTLRVLIFLMCWEVDHLLKNESFLLLTGCIFYCEGGYPVVLPVVFKSLEGILQLSK